MSSGGNLDTRTSVDLGNKEVQDAVMHYLDVCFVEVVMLQPNCRTTGLPSYFNAKVNYDTWHETIQDLPHIKFCGKVDVRQNYIRRFYFENNQFGLGWVRYRHGLLWPTARALAKYIWTN
eukprot:4136292-Pyramimonas_sp.AAC.1